MPYRANKDFADMYPLEPTIEASRRMAQTGTQELHDEARDRTPVNADPQPHSKRAPGTMKRSWRVIDAHPTANGFAGEAVNDDRAAEFVEWDTRPHVIRPKTARSLRWYEDGVPVFAAEVHHPGTQGVHMMRDAAAVIDANFDRILAADVERWRRDYEEVFS